jgi:DMSO/TMAO reductase YedYZ molybdopterin-dependent catalytic subunit
MVFKWQRPSDDPAIVPFTHIAEVAQPWPAARFEFSADDQLGFWERNGYSNSADPWREERYSEG